MRAYRAVASKQHILVPDGHKTQSNKEVDDGGSVEAIGDLPNAMPWQFGFERSACTAIRAGLLGGATLTWK